MFVSPWRHVTVSTTLNSGHICLSSARDIQEKSVTLHLNHPGSCVPNKMNNFAAGYSDVPL